MHDQPNALPIAEPAARQEEKGRAVGEDNVCVVARTFRLFRQGAGWNEECGMKDARPQAPSLLYLSGSLFHPPQIAGAPPPSRSRARGYEGVRAAANQHPHALAPRDVAALEPPLGADALKHQGRVACAVVYPAAPLVGRGGEEGASTMRRLPG